VEGSLVWARVTGQPWWPAVAFPSWAAVERWNICLPPHVSGSKSIPNGHFVAYMLGKEITFGVVRAAKSSMRSYEIRDDPRNSRAARAVDRAERAGTSPSSFASSSMADSNGEASFPFPIAWPRSWNSAKRRKMEPELEEACKEADEMIRIQGEREAAGEAGEEPDSPSSTDSVCTKDSFGSGGGDGGKKKRKATKKKSPSQTALTSPRRSRSLALPQKEGPSTVITNIGLYILHSSFPPPPPPPPPPRKVRRPEMHEYREEVIVCVCLLCFFL